MEWKKISGLVLFCLFGAAAALADVVPPPYPSTDEPPRKEYVSYFVMKVGQIPPGMVLFFVDEDGNAFGPAHEKERLLIRKSGAFYVARENQLSRPFSLKKDRARLHMLMGLDASEFPRSYSGPIPPTILKCTVTKTKSGGYVMSLSGEK